MTTGYLDVQAVRDDDRAPASATTLVRLLALLPPDWSCTEAIGPNWIRLRIALTAPADEATARGAVRATLADPALRGWRLTGLRTAA
ncbi:hypothetical protein I3F58_01065 [Streptomyces sp. MUM 203J]|uniref:hypothetical protein n=1 Tax=Streptomyces sp. MUM 203J TaxID=2791990 RepID=UPI001F04354A|nr:hypothetical protein [Streptomyces sp. MUM 203J]MCH0538171.1 hypothetical protein [Streptomyces sp. MUM 203J]